MSDRLAALYLRVSTLDQYPRLAGRSPSAAAQEIALEEDRRCAPPPVDHQAAMAGAVPEEIESGTCLTREGVSRRQRRGLTKHVEFRPRTDFSSLTGS